MNDDQPAIIAGVMACLAVIAMVLAFATKAEAAEGMELRLDHLHLSHHHQSGSQYNEVHKGQGLSLVHPSGYAFGYHKFTNSHDRESTYLYVRHCLYNGEILCLGYTAGLITGYREPVAAVGRAELSVPVNESITVYPSMDFFPGVVTTLGVSVGWRFD